MKSKGINTFSWYDVRFVAIGMALQHGLQLLI